MFRVFFRKKPSRPPHKRTKVPASERSSQLLRRREPRLIMLERLGNDIAPRQTEAPATERRVQLRRLIAKQRLPFYGLRSQRQYVPHRQDLGDIQRLTGLDYLVKPDLPEGHKHCIRRAARKRVLFHLGIAGRGKRLSPGRGGSYRRTPESALSC